MTTRDRQICDKILAEIAIANDLLVGVSAQSFLRDERTIHAVGKGDFEPAE